MMFRRTIFGASMFGELSGVDGEAYKRADP
jgi:hypothetical protein